MYVGVGGIEVRPLEEFDTRRVEAILTRDELDERAISRVAYGVIVRDCERLEVLDEASLQVA